MTCFLSSDRVKPLIKKIKEIHDRSGQKVQTGKLYEVVSRVLGHNSWNHYSAHLNNKIAQEKEADELFSKEDEFGMFCYPYLDLRNDQKNLRQIYRDLGIENNLSESDLKLILGYINDSGHELFNLPLLRFHLTDDVINFPNVDVHLEEKEEDDDPGQEKYYEFFSSGEKIVTATDSDLSELLRVRFVYEIEEIILYSYLEYRPTIESDWETLLGIYSCSLTNYSDNKFFHQWIDVAEISPDYCANEESDEIVIQKKFGFKVHQEFSNEGLDADLFVIIDPFENLSNEASRLFDKLFYRFIHDYVFGGDLMLSETVFLTLPSRAKELAKKYNFESHSVDGYKFFCLAINPLDFNSDNPFKRD